MVDYELPVFADADTGHGSVRELVYSYIMDALAAAIHIEDQDTEVKKCGHMNGKVSVPFSDQTLYVIRKRHGYLALHMSALFDFGIHIEDQDTEVKKCGHMKGKVSVPFRDQMQRLIEARNTAAILKSFILLVARTD